jgi:arginyl-tRNA synthetase
MKAGMQGLDYDANILQGVRVQKGQLTRGGEPVRMGKRTGEFVSLEEVLEEVGRDAARFFFLMRKADSHLDFDLDLAKRQSSDNPVFTFNTRTPESLHFRTGEKELIRLE